MADPFTDFRQQVARGDTTIFTATITRPPGGPPVDLAGADLVCTGRRTLDEPAGDYVFRLDTTSGITVTDPTAGLVRVRIPAAATAGLPDWPSLYVDLQLTESDGRVSTPLRGRLVLTPDVTRATTTAGEPPPVDPPPVVVLPRLYAASVTTSDPSTASPTHQPFADLSVVATTLGGPVLCLVSAVVWTTALAAVELLLRVDGFDYATRAWLSAGANDTTEMSLIETIVPSSGLIAAGPHTVAVRWRVSSGQVFSTATDRSLSVLVLPS